MRYTHVEGSGRVLGEIGAEILVETARLWQDLGFYGADNRFHIHGYQPHRTADIAHWLPTSLGR